MSIIAKSDGETLVSHTQKLLKVLDHISTDILLKDEEKNIVSKACKLHDIGKIKDEYQELFRGKKANPPYYHNVYSWAFCLGYIKDPNRKEIANLCLWHHGNISDCSDLTFSSVLQGLSVDELNEMKSFAKFFGFDLYDEEYDDYLEEINNSFYQDGVKTNYRRSVLIFADACASAHLTMDEIDSINKKEVISHGNISSTFLESERTIEQLSIVSEIKDNKTTVVKASAGFGKTMIGLLWTLSRNKKLIWVCPTNTISSSVYENLLSDLKLVSPNKEISIELYLSGKKVSSTHNLEDFTSDIVVTNIDNFIKPTVDNSFAKRSLMLYHSDVIFDEVHEIYNMDCALLKAFVNIMNFRNESQSNTTVLMSATTTCFLFGGRISNNKIEYLPNEDSHYVLKSNTKKYNIKFIEKDQVDSCISNLGTNDFAFFSNIVDDVQDNYLSYDREKLICHGKYLDDDKSHKKTLVFDNYGKNGARKEKALFSNQILGTACDFSMRNLFIDTPTIVSFFQYLGRGNRWGTFEDCNIYIIVNNYTRSNNYFHGGELELQKLFISEFMKECESKDYSMNLDELYRFYNKFIKEFSKKIENYTKDLLIASTNRLKEIYPFKYKSKRTKEHVTAGSNQMRATDNNEIYISVSRRNTSSRVTVPYSYNKLFDTTYIFEENSKTIGAQIKIIKNEFLTDKIDHLIKKDVLNKGNLLKHAKNYETPYVVFNHMYDSDIGLRKNTK